MAKSIPPSAYFTSAELRSLKAEFNKADANKDGNLEYSEFKKLFSAKIHSEDELKSLYKVFDKDNSGKVSTNEFFATLAVISKGNINQKLECMFDLFDADKSGTLTQGEVTAILTHIQQAVSAIHHDDTLGKLIADEIKGGLDSNKDGKISKEEFVSFAAKKPAIVQAFTIQF